MDHVVSLQSVVLGVLASMVLIAMLAGIVYSIWEVLDDEGQGD